MTTTTAPLMHTNRQDPYGLKGSLLETTDATEAMRQADLDWTVQTMTTLVDTPGNPMVLPDTYATVRQDPDDKLTPMAPVGKNYHPLQNETVFHLLQDIVDASGATFTAAGHTHGSRRTFVKMLLPEGTAIKGMDPLETSIVAFNSHDGSGQLTLIPTAIRLFCTNQFPALKRSEVKFRARHTTGSLNVGLDAIRASLDLMFTSLHTVQEIGDTLADRPFSDAEFDAFLNSLIPRGDRSLPENLQLRSSVTRADAIRATFRNAPNLDNVRGTQWAALQAVIEVMDWSAKGDKAERMVVRSPSSEKVKSDALRLLLPSAAA